MVKKLLLLTLMFSSLTILSACTILGINEKVDEEIIDTTEIREDLITFIEKFDTARYEDTKWEHDSQNMIFKGTAHIVMAERDKSINLLIAEDNKIAMIELVLDPSNSRQEVLVWNLMITYTNLDKQIYIHLDYYHYNKFLIKNYTPEKIPQTFHSYAAELSLLTMQDVEAILIYMGYDEIEWGDN